MAGSRWPPRSAPTPAGSRASPISRASRPCSNAVRRSMRWRSALRRRCAMPWRLGHRGRAPRPAREAAGGDAGGGRGAEVPGRSRWHDRLRRLALTLRVRRRSRPRVVGRPRPCAASRSSGAKTSASGTRARRGSGSRAVSASSIRASMRCRLPPPSCRVRSSSQPRRWSSPESCGADRRRARPAQRRRHADHDGSRLAPDRTTDVGHQSGDRPGAARPGAGRRQPVAAGRQRRRTSRIASIRRSTPGSTS